MYVARHPPSLAATRRRDRNASLAEVRAVPQWENHHSGTPAAYEDVGLVDGGEAGIGVLSLDGCAGPSEELLHCAFLARVFQAAEDDHEVRDGEGGAVRPGADV
ncbi:hypothetical protein GCM10020000_87410 [Streptomyces olivoverticillatus]